MTIRIQPQGLADRLLARFGKKRAVYVPDEVYRYGDYVAHRESFLQALFRPRNRTLPPGWMYWEDPPVNDPPHDQASEIATFFAKATDDLCGNLGLDERSLLDAIGFALALRLAASTKSIGLFGEPSLNPDYVSSNGETIVECKYIRKGKDGGFNEYDIKNGLAQILEQAVCQKKPNAVFVLLDAGRACMREWNSDELTFVQTFKNNGFGIRLTVVRVRIEPENKHVVCQMI